MKKSISFILFSIIILMAFSGCAKRINNEVKMVAEELKQANVVPDLSTIFSEEGVDNSTQSMKNLSHSAPVVRTTASRHDYMVEGGTFDALKKGKKPILTALIFSKAT